MMYSKSLILSLGLSWNTVSSFETAFVKPQHVVHSYQTRSTQLFASKEQPSSFQDESKISTSSSQQMSRTSFLSSLLLLGTAATPNLVFAEENDDTVTPASTTKTYSITNCPPRASTACVSTTSVKGNAMKAYSGPWSFTCEPEKAFSTLLDILKSESNSITITNLDKDAMYIQAIANRNLGVSDTLEFYVKAEDQVIIYKSIQNGLDLEPNAKQSNVNDLGANKKRLERLRKMSDGVFGVMGEMGEEEYLNAANGGSNGPLGQLKAFYGLQSGGGFEDVFD